MKRRLLFLVMIFLATLLMLVVQKPIFLLFYASRAAAFTVSEWFAVVGHGLSLDLSVAGYVMALPLVVVVASLWFNLPDRLWRRIFIVYLILVSLFSALVFAVDLGLYAHWGFRINATVLGYLADPKTAMASIGLWEAVRQTLIFGLYLGGMICVYMRVVKLFNAPPVRLRLLNTGFMLLLAAGLFVVIRGGISVATANVSKVYFSSNMFLNHAATNPLFSLISTMGKSEDYNSIYPFFDEAELVTKFELVRGNRFDGRADSVRLLRTERPNVVIVILEGFGESIVSAQENGQDVMPNMQQFKREGVWFENILANSFRTDRGEVAVLSGFPAQTGLSIMKLPEKSQSLPSIARSLGRVGYKTSFTYGGDLNFTNQASYMYATGWQTLVWQKDMHFNAPISKWGYADDVVTNYFADQVVRLSGEQEPFLAGLLTLSSHEPFDVPFSKFDNKMLNAMAFTDHCVGRMVAKLKESPAWDNLLLILIADHGYPYPDNIEYHSVAYHHIPMIWLGGAVESAQTVAAHGSQIDLAATLLAQVGVDHSDFDYSKDMLDARVPKFGYYVFEDGFGVVDNGGVAIYDCISGRVLEQSNPALLDVGRAMLQSTYQDIATR